MLSMLSRIAAGAAIILCAGSGFADGLDGLRCRFGVGVSEVCAPFVGCVGEQGDFFIGRAPGRTEGTLAVQTNSGILCSGDWVALNFLGVGQANFRVMTVASGSPISPTRIQTPARPLAMG